MVGLIVVVVFSSPKFHVYVVMWPLGSYDVEALNVTVSYVTGLFGEYVKFAIGGFADVYTISRYGRLCFGGISLLPKSVSYCGFES